MPVNTPGAPAGLLHLVPGRGFLHTIAAADSHDVASAGMRPAIERRGLLELVRCEAERRGASVGCAA